jgi:hypothetical protein
MTPGDHSIFCRHFALYREAFLCSNDLQKKQYIISFWLWEQIFIVLFYSICAIGGTKRHFGGKPRCDKQEDVTATAEI